MSKLADFHIDVAYKFSVLDDFVTDAEFSLLESWLQEAYDEFEADRSVIQAQVLIKSLN